MSIATTPNATQTRIKRATMAITNLIECIERHELETSEARPHLQREIKALAIAVDDAGLWGELVEVKA